MIASERLLFIPFEENLITDNYIGWLNDKNIMKYSEQRHVAHDRETALKYFKSFTNTPHIYLAILDKVNRNHIGNILAHINIPNNVSDISILIGGEHHGKGVGNEAWFSMMKYLFIEKNIRKITAGTMMLNKGMLKIFENNQMKIEGIRKKQFLLEGKEVDAVLVGILKDEFLDWQSGKI